MCRFIFAVGLKVGLPSCFVLRWSFPSLPWYCFFLFIVFPYRQSIFLIFFSLFSSFSFLFSLFSSFSFPSYCVGINNTCHAPNEIKIRVKQYLMNTLIKIHTMRSFILILSSMCLNYVTAGFMTNVTPTLRFIAAAKEGDLDALKVKSLVKSLQVLMLIYQKRMEWSWYLPGTLRCIMQYIPTKLVLSSTSLLFLK